MIHCEVQTPLLMHVRLFKGARNEKEPVEKKRKEKKRKEKKRKERKGKERREKKIK